MKKIHHIGAFGLMILTFLFSTLVNAETLTRPSFTSIYIEQGNHSVYDIDVDTRYSDIGAIIFTEFGVEMFAAGLCAEKAAALREAWQQSSLVFLGFKDEEVKVYHLGSKERVSYFEFELKDEQTHMHSRRVLASEHMQDVHAFLFSDESVNLIRRGTNLELNEWEIQPEGEVLSHMALIEMVSSQLDIESLAVAETRDGSPIVRSSLSILQESVIAYEACPYEMSNTSNRQFWDGHIDDQVHVLHCSQNNSPRHHPFCGPRRAL